MEFLTETPLLFTLLALVVAGVFGAMNLVVLWALYSRCHWFLRASAVLLAFLVLLPTGAYEVVYFFAWYVGFLVSVILPVRLAQRVREWKRVPPGNENRLLPQFHLRDLLLATLLTAATLATTMYAAPRIVAITGEQSLNSWSRDPWRDWFHSGYFASTAAVAAAMVLFHCWAHLRAKRSFRRIAWFVPLYLVSVLFGIGFLWGIADWLCLDEVYSDSILECDCRAFNYGLSVIVWPAFTVWFVCVGARVYPLTSPAEPRLGRRLIYAGLYGIAFGTMLAALVPAAWVYCQLVELPNLEPRPVPQRASGYQTLLGLSLTIRSRTYEWQDLDNLADHEIKFVKKAHAALSRPGHLSVDREGNDRHFDLVRLAKAFEVEAKLAAKDGRPHESAMIAVDMIRLAHRAAHGGTLVNWATGEEIARLGERGMRIYRTQLEPDAQRTAIRYLEEIEHEREPHESFWRRTLAARANRESISSSGSWRALVLSDLVRLVPVESPYYRETRQLRPRSDAVLRLLVVDLAVRAYRNDHELPPAELSQLVPEYLQRIPDDPYGSGPLIYKPQGTDFVLYSVGPNGIDDGGDFVVIEEPFSVPHTGDFCFDQEYAQSDPEHAP